MANTGKQDDQTPRAADRRGDDRRIAQAPFEGAERRAGDRRSGRDRRMEARTRLQP
jgi:hypothetical protein